ncbi:MAG: hypothetical protein V3V50_06115 [Gammaproteobacteria bacterium]
MASETGESALLVDAHVHIYECFDIEKLLDAALRNFNHAATALGINGGYAGVLLLAETCHDNWFQQSSDINNLQRWKIEKTPDNVVLRAVLTNNNSFNKKTLYIFAGRQIITSEGLELLALATTSSFQDGLTLASTLSIVREQDAIPVLPWAVGKWLGKRGKLLSYFLQNEGSSDICMGDNSGRPVFWRNPTHFQQAQMNGLRLLPGTDPLPFSNETSRVGSFGFIIQGDLGNKQAAADLKRLIRNKSLQITTYGKLETPLRFFINQARLRFS